MNRRLKKPVIYVIYGLSFCLLLGGIIMLEITTHRNNANPEEEYQYVSDTVLDEEETEDDDIPVVAQKTTIVRPYTDKDVKIVKDYYDYKGNEDEQKKSIIYYENTYMPSSGVSYGKGSSFDVVSILDGTVKEVTEDTTYGNIIRIEHDKGLVSTYESLTDIKVKKGDKVKQGDILAKSGTSNLSKDLDNHLYFELSLNGVTVNPENYYDKSVDEL
jgi:stage II sporulation protein Q